jgi:hypothetical protein
MSDIGHNTGASQPRPSHGKGTSGLLLAGLLLFSASVAGVVSGVLVGAAFTMLFEHFQARTAGGGTFSFVSMLYLILGDPYRLLDEEQTSSGLHRFDCWSIVWANSDYPPGLVDSSSAWRPTSGPY